MCRARAAVAGFVSFALGIPGPTISLPRAFEDKFFVWVGGLAHKVMVLHPRLCPRLVSLENKTLPNRSMGALLADRCL